MRNHLYKEQMVLNLQYIFNFQPYLFSGSTVVGSHLRHPEGSAAGRPRAQGHGCAGVPRGLRRTNPGQRCGHGQRLICSKHHGLEAEGERNFLQHAKLI